MNASTIPRLGFGKRVVFSFGQLGWSLATYAAANFLTYFYLPPDEGGVPIFPAMVPQGYVFLLFTVVGLVLGLGRLFDAFTDPVIAVLSDRNKSKLGRRRIFMLAAAFPLAVFSFLVFVPLGGSGSGAHMTLNSVWLFIAVNGVWLSMTIYVTPYFAWMSELGGDSKGRLGMATMLSITWALGAMIGAQAPALQSLFQGTGMSPLAAFQTTMLIFSGLALVLMLLPIVFIDEKKYSTHSPAHGKIWSSIGEVVKDRNFLIFTLSDFAYWTSLYFINTALIYYITVLLGLPKEFYSFVFIVMFLVSFAFYVPVNFIARKTGKRPLLMFAFVMFAVVFVACSLLGLVPIAKEAQAWIVCLLATIPLAIFGILPNAMIADMAEAHAIKTGSHKAAVFFGFRTFMQKMGQTLGTFLFPSLAIIGAQNAAVGTDGVRTTAIVALVFCATGFILLTRYKEKPVLALLGKESAGE